MKIVNGDCVEEDEVGISKVSITYVQTADNNQNDKTNQYLTVETEDAWCDDDITFPYYLTIKTDRWAFDNISDIIEILKDFENRVVQNGNKN